MKDDFDNIYNWYVYRHIRIDKNIPFYIGIGKKKDYGRAYEDGLQKRNKIWARITYKTEWKVDILFDNITKEEASKKEQEFILLYGRIDNNTGILSNMTDGGDGVWGHKMSDETKQKIRITKIGDKNPAFGKTPSKQILKKRGDGISKNWNNKTTKEKENIIERRRNGVLLKQARPVIVYSYATGLFIGKFDSISRACKILGILGTGHAVQVCKGKRSMVNNYVFIYKSSNQETVPKIEIIKTKRTHSQNTKDKIRISNSMPVLQFSTEGVFIKRWESARSAAIIGGGHISDVCNSARKSSGGFIWKHDIVTI